MLNAKTRPNMLTISIAARKPIAQTKNATRDRFKNGYTFILASVTASYLEKIQLIALLALKIKVCTLLKLKLNCVVEIYDVLMNSQTDSIQYIKKLKLS